MNTCNSYQCIVIKTLVNRVYSLWDIQLQVDLQDMPLRS